MTLLEPKIEKSPTCCKFENLDPEPQLDIKIEIPKKKPKKKKLSKIKMAKNNFGNLAPFISKIKITHQEAENSDYRNFLIQTPEQLILKALCNLDSLKM